MWVLTSLFSGAAYTFKYLVGGALQMARYIRHAMRPLAVAFKLNTTPEVGKFVIDGHITVEQFRALSPNNAHLLRKYHVRQLIAGGHINIRQYSTLTRGAVYVLNTTPEVHQFFIDAQITAEQFIALLNSSWVLALRNAHVRQLIIDGHITVERFNSLRYEMARALLETQDRKSVV
mgnify:FL=1